MKPQIFKTKVISNKKVTDDVNLIKIAKPKYFEFIPGQYISISVFDKENKKIRRPYSISSSVNEKYLEICLKCVKNGLASNYICSLKKGDEVEFFGPLGKFVVDKNSWKKDLIFISSGTGIGPFISIISYLLENNFKKKIILISAFKNENEVLYKKKINSEKRINILSQPIKNYKREGYIQDFLNDFIPKNFDGDFYICGLKEMVDAVKDKLKQKNVEEKRIFFEKYD